MIDMERIKYTLQLRQGKAGILIKKMTNNGSTIAGFFYKDFYLEYFIGQLKYFVSGGTRIRVLGFSRDEIRDYFDKYIQRFTKDISDEILYINKVMELFVFDGE